MKSHFNFRTLVIITLFVAALAAWRVDRSKLQDSIDTATNQSSALELRNDELQKHVSVMMRRMEGSYGISITDERLFGDPKRVK